MERLVIVGVSRRPGAPRRHRLVYGKVLPNGKTIIKASVIENLGDELGIERGEGILI